MSLIFYTRSCCFIVLVLFEEVGVYVLKKKKTELWDVLLKENPFLHLSYIHNLLIGRRHLQQKQYVG